MRDGRVRFEPARQVARHRCRQRLAAHQQAHPARRAAEEHRRLARRIAAADDDRLGALAVARLDVGGGVVDARALERLQPLDRQAAVLHAGGHHHGAGADPPAVVEGGAEGPVRQRLELADPARHGEAGAELHRLHLAAPDQVGAGNAGGKTHVVLDPARRARLAADRDVLGHQRAQPLGAGVHAGRHARRAAADDQHVEVLVVDQVQVEPEQARDLVRRRVGRRPYRARRSPPHAPAPARSWRPPRSPRRCPARTRCRECGCGWRTRRCSARRGRAPRRSAPARCRAARSAAAGARRTR